MIIQMFLMCAPTFDIAKVSIGEKMFLYIVSNTTSGVSESFLGRN